MYLAISQFLLQPLCPMASREQRCLSGSVYSLYVASYLSVIQTHSLPQSPSHSVSHGLSVPPSRSLALRPFVGLSVCLFFFCWGLGDSQTLSLSLSMSVFLSLFVGLSCCLSPSLSLSIARSLALSLSLSLVLSLSLSPSLYLFPKPGESRRCSLGSPGFLVKHRRTPAGKVLEIQQLEASIFVAHQQVVVVQVVMVQASPVVEVPELSSAAPYEANASGESY